MHKKILLAGLFALVALLAVQSVSAYYDDYSHRYSYQESYGPYGYSYTERKSDETPWGSVTTYTKVKDTYGAGYYGYYGNPVSNYWKYGPQPSHKYEYKTYYGYNKAAYPVYYQSNAYPYRPYSCLYDYCDQSRYY